MTSQGWQPGEYLGAKNAAHAESYTAANASHIRVSIKDDNLGLGAKIGSGVGHGECTGLDAFTNLLGRLNGKDEDELEREQKSREDLKRAIYTERRWGSVRFVPGGFLIGDKIQHLIDSEAERIRKLAAGSSDDSSGSSSLSDSEGETVAIPEEPRKSKKRKMEVLEAVPEVVAIKTKKPKKKRKLEPTVEDTEEVAAALEEVKISKKKSKKERKKQEVEESEDDTDMKQRKKEKNSKKDRKEKRERATSDMEMVEKEPKKKKKSKRDKKRTAEEEDESSQTTTKESTPSTSLTVESSGRSTPMMQGRHAVRARNIAQKRLAHMDVASLNQASLSSVYLVFPLLTTSRSS